MGEYNSKGKQSHIGEIIMTSPEDATRGVRNKNPCNIRSNNNFVWRGQIGRDSGQFCVFSSPELGLRAVCIILTHYEKYLGFTTVEQYIHRWAPPQENPTGHYVGFVAGQLGVSPTAPFNLHNKPTVMLRAMTEFENGFNPYSNTVYLRAVALSHMH